MAAGLVLTACFAALFLVSGGWVRYPMLVGLGFSLFSYGPVGMALVQEQFPENRVFGVPFVFMLPRRPALS